jgi:hypothetical protein
MGPSARTRSAATRVGRERASLINLIAWKFQVHTVDPTAWNSITGHRDVNQTECPGNAAYVSYQA